MENVEHGMQTVSYRQLFVMCPYTIFQIRIIFNVADVNFALMTVYVINFMFIINHLLFVDRNVSFFLIGLNFFNFILFLAFFTEHHGNSAIIFAGVCFNQILKSMYILLITHSKFVIKFHFFFFIFGFFQIYFAFFA